MYGYIYKITNNVNGKTYIGKHMSNIIDDYAGSGKILWKAYKKYGMESFSKTIICRAVDLQHLNALEKYWIAEYRSRGKAEYNIADGGDGFPCNRGKKLSEEYKIKLSEAKKGKKRKPFSNDTKQKISDARKKQTAPMLGKLHSEETKRKMSSAMKGVHKGKHWKLVDGKRVWFQNTSEGL